MKIAYRQINATFMELVFPTIGNCFHNQVVPWVDQLIGASES